MKWKFASWKYASRKFAPGRFRGLGVSHYASHYHKLEGPSKKPLQIAGPPLRTIKLDGCP